MSLILRHTGSTFHESSTLFQVSVGPAVQIHFKNESWETEEIPPHP